MYYAQYEKLGWARSSARTERFATDELVRGSNPFEPVRRCRSKEMAEKYEECPKCGMVNLGRYSADSRKGLRFECYNCGHVWYNEGLKELIER